MSLAFTMDGSTLRHKTRPTYKTKNMKMMKLFRCLSVPTTALLSITLLLSSCGNTAQSIGAIGQRGTVGELSYDAKEQKILGQARGVGALVGAGAGYAIGRNNGGNGLAGALIGGLVGAAAGDGIGKAQANKARSKRLSNNDLRSMITSARANNARLAAYNRKVARRLAEIRSAKASDRAKMAKAEKASVDRAIASTDKMIKQREASRSKMTSSQASQLAVEIRKAKSERATLASHRSKLAKYESVAAN